MKISNLRINGIENPIGFAYEKLHCSWLVTEAVSKKQEHAVIEVSDSQTFTNMLYRKEGNLKQQGESLDFTLQPRTTYYYRVQVTGAAGERAISEPAYFETGKMAEGWTAKWIAAAQEDTFHPIFAKQFAAAGAVKRARLYVTGVGLFEAFLNGKKLGGEFLTPYINHYETAIQVITFPIDQLEEQNTLEILLGKGWYMGTFGLEQHQENYGSRMAAIAELHLEYQDGRSDLIRTDHSWCYRGSDIEDSGIYFGETLNRLLWAKTGNKLRPVEVLGKPEGNYETRNLNMTHLKDRLSLPVVAKERRAVQELIVTPAGETVLDLGQNFAGYLEFHAHVPSGTRVVLDFGEILQGGNFYRGNYAEARSQFVYVADGRVECVRSHFTFFGFRYVRVSGWPGVCRPDDFTGVVLYSDVSRTGYLKTGHQKLNRLYHNSVWGLKSNFIDIPTDCPQRSERLGWTGDAQVFAPTACYHIDTRAFFHKFIKDLKDEQAFLDGGIPNYFPNIGHKKDSGSVWGDIAALLPQALYMAYGDLAELEYCYPLMKGWVDYIDRNDAARGEKQYLYSFGAHFGDWLALDGATPNSFKGSTEDTFIASVYYYRSAQIVSETAGRLGKREAERDYADLAARILAAVRSEYVTPTGRLAVDTQAAYVIAIKFHIYPERSKLIEQFKLRLKKDCNQIKCGFVGAPLLCTALAEAGLYELAYDFLLKEGFPGWLYSVDLGATTIWERWNSVLEDGTMNPAGMNSLNHYAYGSVIEFVYAYAAGIRALEPGYRKAVIAPKPDVRLGWLECRYQSAGGVYVSSWKYQKDGTIRMHIEIPFACEAKVLIPGSEKAQYLKAGNYDFVCRETDFGKPYHLGTALERISGDDQAMKIMEKYVPFVAQMMRSGDPETLAETLGDIRQKTYWPVDPEKLETAIGKVCDLRVL